MQVQVSALFYYPIKSCAGISLQSAELDVRGIKNDRICMVVDAEDRFLTQREHPGLALIMTQMNGSTLTLSAGDMPGLDIELTNEGPSLNVKVWKDTCLAIDQGAEPGEWLQQYLGIKCRLVRMEENNVRPVNPDFAVSRHDQVSFVDGFQFHLLSEASLHDLNARLPEPLPMNRFRPNIVVRGCPSYAEDKWKQISISEVEFSVVKPCIRCVIPTTDQATAQRNKEPLKTLETYRFVKGMGVTFGQNLIHHGIGTIHVGDTVRVADAC